MHHSDNDNVPIGGKPLTFISMFSGIDAASVAFNPIGWKALAFAEIEKFPSAVLAHHYPEVPNVGDMSKHDWAQYRGKVDIVCGGPPCQAFSVAGLREGMADPRGNLSLVYMRALHAINPRNAIVENVPGWLSSADNAFGCFLAGLVGADDALPPPAGRRWPNAGMVAGPKGRAAWRILDAQYFGLAQRRKRVIVIADFGNGADPASVLFERVGLQGNIAPSRETRQDVAPTISARTKGGGGLGTDFDLDGGLIAASLKTSGYSDQIGYENNLVPVATFDRQSNCEYGEADIASSVMARDYKSPTDLVAHCLAGNMLNRAAENGPMGSGISNDVSFTLTKNDVQAVCITGEITHALKAEGADASEDGTWRGNPIVAQTVAIRGRDGGATAELGGEVATALRASGGGGDKAHVLSEVHPTLCKSTGGPGSQDWETHAAVYHQSAVRRLTPVECERLQGFPDSYTDIPWRNKPTSPDGPRYKSLGNSWAVPKFTWIGERINRMMPANNNEATNEAA